MDIRGEVLCQILPDSNVKDKGLTFLLLKWQLLISQGFGTSKSRSKEEVIGILFGNLAFSLARFPQKFLVYDIE